MKRYIKSAKVFKIIKSSNLEPGMVVDSDTIQSVNTTNSGNVYIEFESGDRANFEKQDKIKVRLNNE